MFQYIYFIKEYLSELLNNGMVKSIVSFLCIFIWFVFGDINISAYALLLLYVLDFLMWFLKAFQTNNIQASKLKIWILKLILYWIAIITGNLVDMSMFGHPISYWLKYFIVIYLSINEWISILKHLTYRDTKLPIALIKKLERYKSNMDNCDDLFVNKKE